MIAVDQDGNGTIDKEEFEEMMERKMLVERNPEQEILKVYKYFDEIDDDNEEE